MTTVKYINGFAYHPLGGYIGINNGDIESPLRLTEDVIGKVLKTMKKNNIERLYFGYPDTKNNDISFLENFKFLKGIRIGLDDFEIGPLCECHELEDITISFGYKGTINFSIFPKLQSLTIDWRNKGCSSVFGITNMRELSLINYSGSSLLDFSKLKKIEKLTLTDPKILSLAGVEKFENLKELVIVGAKRMNNIEHIEGCQMLNKVFIHGCRKIDTLHPLMYLKELSILNLENMGNQSSIGFLKPLKKLEAFYMGGSTNVIDGDLNVLQELREKEVLEKIIFTNRKHYSHTREQLGYQVPESVAAIFKKKK